MTCRARATQIRNPTKPTQRRGSKAVIAAAEDMPTWTLSDKETRRAAAGAGVAAVDAAARGQVSAISHLLREISHKRAGTGRVWIAGPVVPVVGRWEH
jgi:hypothetical protein